MYFHTDQPRIKQVFLYLRQSTDERSGKQVRSLGDQQHDCELLADKLHLTIVDTFIEDRSAKAPHNRPVFKQMLKALSYKSPKKRTAEGILAWHPDRLSRNALESGQIMQMLDDELIQDLFFPAYSFHNDPSGKEHIAIEFARAKGYVDRLSVNVSRGTQGREKEGAMMYPVKFGYRKRREIPEKPQLCSLFPEPCPINFPIIQRVFALRQSGLSHDAIIEQAKQEGFAAARGTLNRATLSYWLRDPFYYGEWVINPGRKGERRVDLRALQLPDGTTFTPVISEADFWHCQHSDSLKTQTKKRKHINPLSVAIRCHRCQSDLRPAVRKIKRAGGHISPQLGYECQGKITPTQRCPQSRVKGDILFDQIAERLAQVTVKQRDYHQFLMGLNAFLNNKTTQHRKDRQRLSLAVNQLKRQKAELLQRKALLVQAEEYTQDDRTHYSEQLNTLNIALKCTERRYREIGDDAQSRTLSFKQFIERCQTLHQDWSNADPAQKRKISEKILLNLTIDGAKIRSVSWKAPFDTWLKRSKIQGGGASEQPIEPDFEGLWKAYWANPDYIDNEGEVFSANN